MRRVPGLLAVILGVLLMAEARAEPPTTSPRPMPRADAAETPVAATRPLPRPAAAATAPLAEAAPAAPTLLPQPHGSDAVPWPQDLARGAAPGAGEARRPRDGSDANAATLPYSAIAGAAALPHPDRLDRATIAADARLAQSPDASSALRERASTSGVLISPRPAPRALAVAAQPEAAASPLRPRPRPVSLIRPRNPAQDVRVVQPVSRLAILRSPRPAPRPENHLRRSLVRASGLVPTRPNPGAITGQRGAVCGDRRIRGQTLAPIAGRIQGCGLEAPVKVTEVDGVRLSTPATIDCTTAKALTDWVGDVVKPTVGRLGGGVASLQVFAHYSCRTRNNQPGAKVSEHGRGRAIDIGAINLANGSSLTVLDHWRSSDLGALLKTMHKGACGRFGTVLGPQSDRFHQNHFHLDTARYRSGSYCR